MFGFLKKAVKTLGKVVKPLAGTAAVVFPPVGVPLAAGVAVSDRVLKAANSKDPKKRAAGKRMIQATSKLAATGHVGAANGMTLLGKRAAALRAARSYRMHPRSGRLERVKNA